MKNWVAALLVIILVGTAVNAYLYSQTLTALNDTRSQVSTLNSDLSTVKVQLTTLEARTPSQVQVPSSTSPAAAPPAVTFTQVASQIAQVVVRIDVTGPGTTGQGSGIIISNKGYILTAEHVIDAVTSINITTSNNDKFTATVVASDVNLDIAVLKMNTTRTDFPAVLGDSAGVVIGQDVVVVGFPFATQIPGPVTFTKGIVSALRTYQNVDYIQTDAIVNPGNSGGCLATLDGKVIGIVDAEIISQSMDAEAIDLCLPINTAKVMIQSAVPK